MAKTPKKRVSRLPPGERVVEGLPDHFTAAPTSLDDYDESEGMRDPDYEDRLQDAFGYPEEETESYHAGRPAPLDKIFR